VTIACVRLCGTAGSVPAAAAPLPGEINSSEDEVDATFLADGRGVVFSRARDLTVDNARLLHSKLRAGRYPAGELLPARAS
jgi:TolB protein